MTPVPNIKLIWNAELAMFQTGIAGIIKPKPTATKNATADKTETSRGSSAKGFLFDLLFFI